MQLGALFDCYEVTIFAFTVIIHTIKDSMAVEVQMLAAVDLYEPVEGAVVVALYVAAKLDKQRDMVVDGRFLDKGKKPNREVLQTMREALAAKKDAFAVLERIESQGMAVGDSVFRTCEWVGRFSQAAEEMGACVDYVYRRDEKLCLCESSRAKDKNIRRALIDRYATFDKENGRGTKARPDVLYGFSADAWSALAVYTVWKDEKDGLYHSARRKTTPMR